MATVTLKGNEIHTNGNLPDIGENLKDFTLVASDLSEKSLADFAGKKVVLNIYKCKFILIGKTCALPKAVKIKM